MRTLVEVVARPGPGGRTVFPVVRAAGQLAVRRTGPTTVHLVATAFGPLGGDDAEVRLVVEAGARLTVCTVAAAVVLPARGASPPSAQRVVAEVAGALELAPQATVVTAGAHHHALLHAQLADDAELTATEQVQLGRTGEEPGRWTGTTRVERSGAPVLHTTVGLGPGAAAWLPPVAPRAWASTVHLGRERERVTGEDAVRLPLERGWVASAWGERLTPTLARLAQLGEPAPAVEVSS